MTNELRPQLPYLKHDLENTDQDDQLHRPLKFKRGEMDWLHWCWLLSQNSLQRGARTKIRSQALNGDQKYPNLTRLLSSNQLIF